MLCRSVQDGNKTNKPFEHVMQEAISCAFGR